MTELNPEAWMGGVKIHGKILFAKVWGSHSHNTNLPTSDVDYEAVYVAPTRDILSLRPPPETIERKKPDCQIHEVKKFAALLLKGNPAIVEMLFTERMAKWDIMWNKLREHRHRFLSAKVVKQYLGYAQAQLHRYERSQPVHAKGGVPGEKWCYHMVRVAWDAERIARGEGPLVWKEGEEREKLMAIRTGAWSTEKAVEEAKTTIARIDANKPWKVPEEQDEQFLNDWLVGIRVYDF